MGIAVKAGFLALGYIANWFTTAPLLTLTLIFLIVRCVFRCRSSRSARIQRSLDGGLVVLRDLTDRGGSWPLV